MSEMTKKEIDCIKGNILAEDRKYWCFLLSSFFTFALGVSMVLGQRLLGCIFFRNEGEKHSGFLNEAKEWAGELLSGQTKAGKLLNGVVFVISICSQLTYFYDARETLVERCIADYPPTLKFDITLNMLFMAYFFMRFIAANDKLAFMFSVYSLIDFFTIPPSFVSLILGRTWIGLRCLRILRLNSFPEILQYLNILETARAIRLLQLVAMFMSIWWTAAGFIHLIENYGDPPL